MERGTTEGDSPVGVIDPSLVYLPSSTGHVKPDVNQGGPSPKAKY